MSRYYNIRQNWIVMYTSVIKADICQTYIELVVKKFISHTNTTSQKRTRLIFSILSFNRITIIKLFIKCL